MLVELTAGEEVRAAIGRVGRTEDVQFSPDCGRVAVAGLTENRVLIVSVEADWDSDPPAIALSNAIELESDALLQPHGVCWLDERTLVVANREGRVAIFELPERSASGKIRLSPARIVGEEAVDLIYTPGSVSATRLGLDLIELLICNNYAHYVSRHLLDRRNGFAPIASDIVIRDGLEVPDGVVVSRSGRWIAISNLGHALVAIYRNDGELGPASQPHAVLKGVHHPHGVRFTADERAILVADSSEPFVRLYRGDGTWDGELEPDASIRVMDEKTFKRGTYNGYLGGPKGLDVTRDGKLMVISCLEAPLSFFDMRGVMKQPDLARPADRGEAEHARDTLLRYLAADRGRVEEATRAIHLARKLDIEKILNSRSYKITAPLRWARATLSKVDPRQR